MIGKSASSMRFAIAFFLSCCATTGISAEYGEYPESVSEIAYFVSGEEWGDPNNQHRFAAIRTTNGNYQTKNGTYSSLQELLDIEDLTKFEGIAIRHSFDTPNSQREIQNIFNTNGIHNLFFWPNSESIDSRQIFLGRTTGKVSGMVTAAEDGEPLEGAHVWSEYFGGNADENGEYEVTYLDPGLVKLIAGRRDREDVEVEIQVVAGQTTRHDFVLPAAKPACCKLEGKWEIILTLTDDKRPDDLKPYIVGDTTSGVIIFSPKYEAPVENHRSDYSDNILEEYGEYDIDLTPFFGKNITASISNTVFPGNNDPDPLKQVDGSISHYDQVEISFIPRMSHGGISLGGKIVDDSEITGKWYKRDYSPMVWGTFVMKRINEP